MPKYCEQCGDPQSNQKGAKCDNCGHSHDKNATSGGGGKPKPTKDGLYSQVLNLLQRKNSGATLAEADAMINLFEPQADDEQPDYRIGPHGNQYWAWPYQDRIMYLTRKYLCADADLQRLIHAAHEDGIWWRGTCDRFHEIIAATEEYRLSGGHSGRSAKSFVNHLRESLRTTAPWTPTADKS